MDPLSLVRDVAGRLCNAKRPILYEMGGGNRCLVNAPNSEETYLVKLWRKNALSLC